ncbi:MAG TPA: hypothetical protein VGR76_16935 [Candidatus Angelobacter sp.]|nr:hypothetical protein [Candidatus Angelobacter sp.]
MRGFAGFLFDVLLPALFLGLFGLAIAVVVRADRRRRHLWPESFQPSSVPALRKLFKLAAVSAWTIIMIFVVYRGLRIHYDLWALQPKNVEAVYVGGHQFTDRSSIAQIVTALKASEWYSVNHGGWGDETPVIVKMGSGEEWQMMAGYHFAQHGAVILRSSGPGGSGLQLGQVFSPVLPNVLEQLGVPLSHCDTAHGRLCGSLQQPH